MMSSVYSEGIMKDLGYLEENISKRLITEEIQPRCILFKTNYRSIDEAKIYVQKLENNLKKFL